MVKPSKKNWDVMDIAFLKDQVAAIDELLGQGGMRDEIMALCSLTHFVKTCKEAGIPMGNIIRDVQVDIPIICREVLEDES